MGNLATWMTAVSAAITVLGTVAAAWFTYKNKQQEITRQAELKAEEARLTALTAKGIADNVADAQANQHSEVVLSQVLARVASLESALKEDRERADRREEMLRKENADCWQRHNLISTQLARLETQAEMRAKERKDDSLNLHRQVAELKSTITAVVEPPKEGVK